jgi:hypothetical protein
MKARLSAVLIVGSLALAGCGSSTPAAPTKADARLACDHYRNVLGDVSQGILTPSEIRSKMKQVNDDAIIAPADVQSAATGLLAAATQDDGTAFLGAIGTMSKACAAAGF